MDALKFLAALARLLMQGGDYAIKAFAAYRETPDGAKEWLDVENALVEIGALHPADASGSASSVPEWVSSSPDFPTGNPVASSDVSTDVAPGEKPASVKGAGLPVIRRMPRVDTEDGQ